MGVMACSRNECSNVMCDRYSEVYGYICNECLYEMKEKCINKHDDIKAFMESDKRLSSGVVDLDEEFWCNDGH